MPEPAPATGHPEIAVTQFNVSARDGYPLGVTKFMPTYVPAGLVVVAGATGVNQQYYRRFAHFLAEQRFITFTFDYRGIAASLRRPIRGFTAYMHEWAEQDLAGILDYVRVQHHEYKPMLVGHSAGGQFIGWQDHVPDIQAAVSVAGQHGYWRNWPGLGKLGMYLAMGAVIPATAKLLGYFPMRALGLGENLPVAQAREWAGWCMQPDYLFGSGRMGLANYPAYRGPLLSLTATDDGYAPRKAVEALLAHYPNARKKLVWLQPTQVGLKSVGHFGYFRSRAQTAVWEPIVRFLYEHA